MPRSDYEHSGRLVEMGEITPEPQLYIDVSVIEYETMKKRIAELEAAYAEIVNAPYEAAQGRIAELEATLNDTAEMWNARYEVALKYISELEMALIDIKHLTDPIIDRSRRALRCKP